MKIYYFFFFFFFFFFYNKWNSHFSLLLLYGYHVKPEASSRQFHYRYYGNLLNLLFCLSLADISYYFNFASMQVLTKGITKARFLPAEGADVLVVLIGWWLAKQRHLSKYEPIWHIHGCATLSFLPNMANSTFISETRQLLRNLEEYLKDNKKVKNYFSCIF